jgi:hypothetical protein
VLLIIKGNSLTCARRHVFSGPSFLCRQNQNPMVARAVSTITQHYYALNKLGKCVVGAVRGQDFMARACFAPVELRSWQVLFPGDHS